MTMKKGRCIMYYHITKKSNNVKTGPIPVTTSSADTCPSACPFRDNGCYANSGPLKLHWNKVSSEERGIDLLDLCSEIEALPDGQLWRHNQAGDLPGLDNDIDALSIADIVEANINKKGYTYTHKPMDNDKNINIVKLSNQAGFTINLSSNNLEHADKLLSLGIAPVVTIVEDDARTVHLTPAGNKVLVCPAQTIDSMSCAKCGLCANSKRNFIIGFKAHGTSAKKLKIASEAY
jgi:hypothetical protein